MTRRAVPDARRTPGYRAFRGLLHAIWAAYLRPEVTGTEHVPVSGAFIIAPVHRSNLDFALAIYVTDRKTFFMAKDTLWKSEPFGRFISTMGAFPVRRGSADRAALGDAEAVLRAGEPLVLFPEGTRQEGPAVGSLLEGASFLAARTGAPIIPVGIGGTDRAMPKGAKLPRPAKVRLVIGAPIEAPKGDGVTRVPRSQVAATTAELREALQGVYDQACGRLSAPAATS